MGCLGLLLVIVAAFAGDWSWWLFFAWLCAAWGRASS